MSDTEFSYSFALSEKIVCNVMPDWFSTTAFHFVRICSKVSADLSGTTYPHE